MNWANAMVAQSQGRAVVVFQEDDQSSERVEDAAHFIKVDGARIGRDLELYGFMGETFVGWDALLPDLITEVLLPIKAKGLTASYNVGADTLKEFGHKIYPPSMHPKWDAIFE